jgi:hypothetical protein
MQKLVALFDQQFLRIHQRSTALVKLVVPDKLYRQPRASSNGVSVYSCGEHILRSSGVVEQTFGGITTNLWDDPFEWTLPETLPTSDLVVDHLEVVETTRRRGFEFFSTDDALFKEIVVPSGEMQTIAALLANTLMKAAHHQGCAFATFRIFSDAKIPGF